MTCPVTKCVLDDRKRLVALERILWRAGILGLALLQPTDARAQGPPLSELLPRLFGQEIVLAAGAHQGHFLNARSRAAGNALNDSITSQLSSSPPVNSSAGGFTYEYDPEQGTYERTSSSFGPIFAERADTLGKGRFNYGISYLHFAFDSLDDISLVDGELSFDLTHEDVTGDGSPLDFYVEGDLVAARTFLELETDVTTVFVNWGVTDRLDLALVVPLVSVSLNARVDASIKELSTAGHLDAEGNPQPIHRFSGDATRAEFRIGGRASGIGDVILRGKYNFKKLEGRALAAAAEVRLPTGDEEDLLGVGDVQAKLFLIGSATFGKLSPHVNLGYTYSAGSLSDEANLAVGFDAPLHPSVTVAVDLLWRTLFDARQVQKLESDHLHRVCVEGCPGPDPRDLPIGTATRLSLDTRVEDQNLAYGSFGLKFNPWGNLLVTANLLYSLSSEGLQDEDLIPLIGVDYSF